MIDLAGEPAGLVGARHRLGELAQLREAPGEPVLREDECQRCRFPPVRTADRPEAPPRPGGGTRQPGDSRQSSARPCRGAGSPMPGESRRRGRWRGRERAGPARARGPGHLPSRPGPREPARARPSRRSSPSASARASASRACSVPFANVAHCHQGAAGGEVEVDGLLRPRATLRKMLERVERLLEAGGRLPVGRALHRLHPGLTEIGDGLLPRLAPERVVGQALDVLREPLGVAVARWPRPPGRGVPRRRSWRRLP